MSSFDTVAFDKGARSLMPDLLKFENLQYQYQQSVAVGTVNNAIQFQRAQAQDFVYYPAGFIMIPVTITTVTATTLAATSSINAPLSIGLKPAGGLSLIDRVNIQINGKPFSNSAPLHSVWVHLRNILRYSRNYLELVGGILLKGRSPPSLEVNCYDLNQIQDTNDAVADFVVTCDNGHVTPSLDALINSSTTSPLRYNRVLYERCMSAAYPSGLVTTSVAATAGSLQNQNALANNVAVVQNVRQSRYLTSASNPAAGGVGGSYYMYCIVPLTEVGDVFSQLGIAQSLGVSITLFVNNCSTVGRGTTGAYTTAGVTWARQSSTSGTFRNSSCPVMLTDIGNATEGTGAATYAQGNVSTFTVQIGYDQGTAAYSELWLPVVTPTPDQLSALIENSKRTILYKDFLQSSVSAVSATGQLNTSIFQSVNSPKKLYVLQFVDASALTSGCQPELNMITCSPYYSDAFQGLYNINVKVNNIPINNVLLQYSYQNFLQNVLPASGIDAGMNPEDAAGLVSADFWNTSKLYVFDLTRACPSGQEVSLSIQATNTSNQASKFLFFVEQLCYTELSMTNQGSSILTFTNV